NLEVEGGHTFFVSDAGVFRRVPGYHDESLQGRRVGQRSVRLSRSYRAIYRVVHGAVEFVRVEEVSKHDY
ncbi:MAG: hypothetical protein AAB426_05280, partial [Myxococcota bacterium]